MENILSPIGLVLIGFGVTLAALIYFSFVKKSLQEKLDEISSKINSTPAPANKPVEVKQAPQPVVTQTKPEPVKEKVEDPELSPELVAVITSAAFHALKRNVKVRKIRLFTQPESNWGTTGRVIVMASHNVR